MKTENINQTNRRRWLFVLIPFIFIIIASSAVYLREYYSQDINISVNDDNDEFQIVAKYPRNKIGTLYHYLALQINISDLKDFNSVVIKKYQMPDEKMTIYLKSKPGYLKIVLDKHQNSKEAYLKLKNLSEGIKRVFIAEQQASLRFEPVFYGLFFFLPFI